MVNDVLIEVDRDAKVSACRTDWLQTIFSELLPEDLPLSFGKKALYFLCLCAQTVADSSASMHQAAELRLGYPHSAKRAKVDGAFTDERPIALIHYALLTNNKPTRAYVYWIRATPEKRRQLGLIHPRSQIAAAGFLRQWSDDIVLLLRGSEISLRFPVRIAAVDSGDSVSTRRLFQMQRYRRPYEFLASSEFLDLESAFDVCLQLDVENAFGSLYTHSISWALTSKEFAKHNLMRGEAKKVLGPAFDRLMQDSNYGETAGIIVGSELSRLFAELVFQRIDRELCSLLSQQRYGLVRGVDFELRRYVDDYYVFARSMRVADSLRFALTECLSHFKLRLNASKSVALTRPFVTPVDALNASLSEYLSWIRREISCRELALAPGPIGRGLDAQSRATDEPVLNDDTLSRSANSAMSVRRTIPAPRYSKAEDARALADKFLSKVRIASITVSGGYALAVNYTLPPLVRFVGKVAVPERDSGNAFAMISLVRVVCRLFLASPNSTTSRHFFEVAVQVRDWERRVTPAIRDICNLQGVIQATIECFFDSCVSGETISQPDEVCLANLITLCKQPGLTSTRLACSTVRKLYLESFLDSDSHSTSVSYFSLVSAIRYMIGASEYMELLRETCEQVANQCQFAALLDDASWFYLALDFLSLKEVEETYRSRVLKRMYDLVKVQSCGSVRALSHVSNAQVKADLEWFLGSTGVTRESLDVITVRAENQRLHAGGGYGSA